MKQLCLVAVTAVLGCVTLAGCGSGRLSKADYQSQLAVILNGAVLAHNALSLGAANVQTVPQPQTKLRRLASAEDHLGDELSALKAPKAAVAANAELAKGEHDDAAELRRLIPKLSKFSGPRQALHFLNRVGHTNGGREQDEAIAKLEKLGYATGVQPLSPGA